MLAQMYEINEKYLPYLKPKRDTGTVILFCLFSWLTCIPVYLLYFDNEKYFWKFSYKELFKQYNDKL